MAAEIAACRPCGARTRSLEAAEKLTFRIRAPLYNLRKNSMLHLILGGAAVYRCDKWLHGTRLILIAEMRESDPPETLC